MKRYVCFIVVAIMALALSASVIAGEYSLNNWVVMASLTLDEGGGGVYGDSPDRGGAYARRDVDASPSIKREGSNAIKNIPANVNLALLEGEIFHYRHKNHLDLYRKKPPPIYVPYTSSSMDFELKSVIRGAMGRGIIDIAAAVVTQVALHEAGHYVVAEYVGAEGNSMAFLTSRDGQF
ncbi:MAG: hypothetical protein ACE5D4_09260, partial [Thermodesulfobacteriota bacterium]